MGVTTIPLRSSARLTCAVAVGCVLGTRVAVAFPATDASNPSIVSTTPEPTESDLRHQLQLQSGFGAGAAGATGWTFVPRISAQEMYTDNVLNSSTDRRWDMVTFLTPGIALVGDVPNAQVRLDYAPQFRVDARTPSQNDITQQLLGTGNFTILPDELFLDARAVAGATPTAPGFGALGTGITQQLNTSNGNIGTLGLSKENQTQVNSVSISPYLLHRFGDTGTAKVGYEFNQSSFSNGGSDFPLFFQTGGSSQHIMTNQGVAQFETGERFAPYRDLIVANISQSNGTGVNQDSSQNTLVNQLGYQINRDVGVFAELGYESLRFGGLPPTRIDDMVWAFGTTVTPNPDSEITISYGHKNGFNAISFNGSYAVTARTRISARYDTGLQSDLQNIQNQLDLAALDTNGNAVDAQTGAPLFIGGGGLGVQNGLFRTKAFTLSANTVLDRDQFSLSLQISEQTTVALAPSSLVASNPFAIPPPPVGQSSNAKTASLSWAHAFSEALSMVCIASYSTAQQSSTGTLNSIGANVSLQYAINETWVTNVRYAYFDRVSATPGQSIYQNLIIVGISKQF
jgi:uncharacterized protein (PEP-CTERM system associated)